MTKLAIWDVTGRCNLRCIHCGVSDIYHRQATGLEVAYEDGLVILRRLYEAGYQRLMLLGGEPLMRDDVVELVAAACRVGFSDIGITTNGTRLTPQLADALLDAGLDYLIVSLDGATAESNDRARGQGAYAQAMQGLETMLQRRPCGSKFKIVVQFTLSRLNLHEAAMIVDLAGQMELDRLNIHELKSLGSARRHAEFLLPSLGEAMDARELALQAALRYPNLALHVFGWPRTMEYFNERFGRDLPISMPSCSLLNDNKVLNLEATGLASACSAVLLEGALGASNQDQDASTEVEYRRLHTHSVSSVLNSPRFDHVKLIGNQSLEEKWQDEFVPCIRCHYRSACQMCPLFLRQQKDRMVAECLLAAQRQARWRKSQERVGQVSSGQRSFMLSKPTIGVVDVEKDMV